MSIPQDAQRAIPEEVWRPYVIEVFTDFLQRTHQSPTRLMGSGEWWTVYKWLRDGVPLRIVLRAMSETKRRPMSLSYYDPAVRQAYARWRQALGGAA